MQALLGNFTILPVVFNHWVLACQHHLKFDDKTVPTSSPCVLCWGSFPFFLCHFPSEGCLRDDNYFSLSFQPFSFLHHLSFILLCSSTTTYAFPTALSSRDLPISFSSIPNLSHYFPKYLLHLPLAHFPKLAHALSIPPHLPAMETTPTELTVTPCQLYTTPAQQHSLLQHFSLTWVHSLPCMNMLRIHCHPGCRQAATAQALGTGMARPLARSCACCSCSISCSHQSEASYGLP